MLLLPVFLMLTASGLIWLTRNSSVRTQWGISAIMALAIWIISLLLRLGPDLQIQISVWQPSEIFSALLSISLDEISWPIMYSIATVLVAMIFTAASREASASISVRVFWFAYSAVAVIAVLADNIITVIISWALFDFLSAIFLFGLLRRDDEIRQVLARLAIDILGVLLVLAGAAVSISSGTGTSLSEPIQSELSVLLLSLGGFVRLGLLPLHFNLPALLNVRRGLGTLYRLYPPAIVLAFFSKLFRAGIPEETLIWFLIAGLSGALLGGLRWVLEQQPISGRPFFVLGMSGLAVSTTATMPDQYMGVVSASILLLLAGSVLSLGEIHTPSHRVLVFGPGMIILGIPFLPGSVLSNIAYSNVLRSATGVIWAVVIMACLAMMILGSLHLYYAQETPWKTGESLVRLSYSLGLSLPALSVIGIGAQLRPVISVGTWIMLGSQFVLVLIGFVILRRIPEGQVGRFQFNLSRFDPEQIYASFGQLFSRITELLRATAGLIEGEAALLWIFAVAAFVFLATR